MFSTTDFFGLYFECMGFAADIIAALQFSWHTIPALAIEIVCCYIPYNKIILLLLSILSNSSIQQIPKSLKTSAPLSNTNYFVSGSRFTFAVKPTALDPLPLV